jgi:hypothetical protein
MNTITNIFTTHNGKKIVVRKTRDDDEWNCMFGSKTVLF